MTVLVTASFTEASRDIQHVPAKLRRCLFYDESSYLPFYTYSDCLLKCRMLFLLAKCKCTPFNMPKMVDNRTCDMRDVPCLRMYNGEKFQRWFFTMWQFLSSAASQPSTSQTTYGYGCLNCGRSEGRSFGIAFGVLPGLILDSLQVVSSCSWSIWSFSPFWGWTIRRYTAVASRS